MKFADIPSRINGFKISNAWFDTLRNAGQRLESFFGSGYQAATFAAIGNTQTGQNITGLIFDHTIARTWLVDYQIRRVSTSTGATERVTCGMGAKATWNALSASWSFTPCEEGGNVSGVTLDVDPSTGQALYTSDTMTGTYDSVNSGITYTLRTIA